MTFFDYLENILKQKDASLMHKHIDDEQFEKTYSSFMIQRYLSMHPSLDISSLIVTNQKALEALSPSAHYRFLMRVIPKTKQSFIRYIK